MLTVDTPKTEKEFEEYFDLRWRILRAPWSQPRGSEKDEYEESADHVTVRNQESRLLGIGRLHLNNPEEAQIRYMATEADCQGLGVGRATIGRLEEAAARHGVKRIVLNAREDVVGFYKRLGYSVITPGPTMFGEIKHSKMQKNL